MKEIKISLPIYLLSILLLSVIIFFDTWLSMINIWWRSDTYTHGFFVIPASLWLIWQNKSIHPYLSPTTPSYIALFFILLNGFIWLLASITQTLVIQQLALVSMLIGGLWFYLGNNTSKKLIFPLIFLYFMVPVGEQELLPYLMEFTATFTVALLKTSGFSVYREGMHFSLISGDWSVVEACSGLRYLIASITLGTIYAYITYNKTYKRALFILASLIFPVIANGLRAYMIVMIGHLSDMQLATGIDHLVYGALFFAVLIFIMFYIGSFWKDPETQISTQSDQNIMVNNYTKTQNNLVITGLLLSFIIWPLTSQQLLSNYHAQTTIPQWPSLSQNLDWQEVNAPNWGWRPEFNGAATQSLRYFKKQDAIIGLYQANFGDEKQGAELVNMQNVLINTEDRKKWHVINQSTLSIKNAQNQRETPIDFSKLSGGTSDIITAKWYQVGLFSTNSPYLAKIHQLYKRLVQNTSPEIYYVVFIKKSTQKNQRPMLQKFISHILTNQNLIN